MEVTTAERYATGGEAPELYARNLALAFARTVERVGDDPAIRDPERGVERVGDDPAIRDPERGVELSWIELAQRTARIAGGLAKLGVGKGDAVALLMSNRWEFIPTDLAAAHLGAVPFSIYQTSSPEQIAYVCRDAEARVAVVEGTYLEAFERARGELPNLEHVVVVDGEGGTHSFKELEELDPGFDAPAAAEAVEPDDLLTLIYTSGTTGPPKGVQLTHRNLMSLVAAVDGIIDLPERGAKVISWLPAAHIAERGAHYYLPVMRGISVTVCPDPRRIVEFLPQVRPTWFFAVPRVWEKLKAGLEAMLAGLPDEQRVPAQKGLDAALQKVRLEQAGAPVPEEIAAAAARADEAMFAGLRSNLGLDELVAVNVGAAPSPVEVLEFFHAIGVPIGELWGMSETCGVITCNPPEKIKIGTVGPPVPGAEVKLADDGEILVRAPFNTIGYRNLPEKTAETILEDGWLATGDIGELDEDGYLRIVDRKKELIINAAGKNMSPANIEAHLKTASPLIGQAVAIGDRRPYNVALIVLDPDYAPVWAQQHGMDGASVADLASDDRVRAAVQEAVDAANAKLARVEQVKKFTILPDEWAPGGDELTPTMKLKRKPIAEKYAAEIEALYAG